MNRQHEIIAIEMTPGYPVNIFNLKARQWWVKDSDWSPDRDKAKAFLPHQYPEWGGVPVFTQLTQKDSAGNPIWVEAINIYPYSSNRVGERVGWVLHDPVLDMYVQHVKSGRPKWASNNVDACSFFGKLCRDHGDVHWVRTCLRGSDAVSFHRFAQEPFIPTLSHPFAPPRVVPKQVKVGPIEFDLSGHVFVFDECGPFTGVDMDKMANILYGKPAKKATPKGKKG